jgi:hypothetical protein
VAVSRFGAGRLTVTDVDSDPDGVTAHGLAGYVRAVATELGLPPEATYHEIDERPAAAYIAVDRRAPGFPYQDVALVWDEENGWAAVIETDPARTPIILGYLGDDVLPPPITVAAFVNDILTGAGPPVREPPALRVAGVCDELEIRLANYASYP